MARQQKQLTTIARVQFRCDHRKVVYLVRSSNGVDQYQTSLFNGKATGCTCPSKKPCYHMKGAEAREAARQEMASQFAAKSMPAWIMQLVNTGKLVAPAKVEKTEKVEAKQEAEAAVREAEKIVATPTYTNLFKKPRKFATERAEADRHYREAKAEAREIRERRQKMDYQSARTLDFFSNLPSRKELASPR